MTIPNINKCRNLYQFIIYRSIAAAFRVEAGRKSIEPNLSNSLVERNHFLDPFFTVKDIVMKEKPRLKDDDPDKDDVEEVLDEAGYKDFPAVGVSSFKLYNTTIGR